MSARLRHYGCGSTRQDIGMLFRGGAGGVRGARDFVSGVFLHDDGRGRRILFDTGYTTDRWETGWHGAAYRRILPPLVEPEDDVALRLREDGIDPATITHVVLSHLHPDHIGGVRRFPQARFVLTEDQRASLAAPRLRETILPGLLPDWFPGADPIVLDRTDFGTATFGGQELHVADPFGDGGFLVVDLPGHARGHVGALVEGRILLAGDAAWGADLLDAAPRMRALPLALQHDGPAYQETAALLRTVRDAGIRVICSHDPVGARELLG